MPRTLNEKIEIAQGEIKQKEALLKNLLQQQKMANRKARTKRLIERGAILESLIPEADTLTNEQIKSFLEKTIHTSFARNALDGVKAQPAPEPPPNPAQTAEPPSGANGGRTGETATSVG